MAVEIEGQVGPKANADGTNETLRTGKTGELCISNTHGVYHEAASRGNVYIAANQTGVTTQAGLSATTPALTLYNPVGSGVLVSLIYAGCVMSVVNAAASVVWLGANTNLVAAAVTGTAAASRNALLGSGATGRCLIYTAATLPAAPVAVAILGVGLTGAITTTPSMTTMSRYFDGTLTLQPGASISFQTSTASGASSFFGEFIFEEIPIV